MLRTRAKMQIVASGRARSGNVRGAFHVFIVGGRRYELQTGRYAALRGDGPRVVKW